MAVPADMAAAPQVKPGLSRTDDPVGRRYRFTGVDRGVRRWLADTVHQHGPPPLWDTVERAFERWETGEFGLTASGEDQRVWIGDPSGPSWLPPASTATA
ncbi:hypothetical protein [Kitasatospora sp. NPDC098663]|uniref:hypothetical protein n=1 Tax=Kitasatospora sp. NPDC098663 TaxID=3364096 RepID=UPI00382D9486